MNIKVYLVRHGPTNFNIEKRMGGGGSKFTSNGIRIVKKIGRFFKSKEIDFIYSSDLIRAKKTANEIVKYHKDKPIIYFKELRELDCGTINGLPNKKFKKDYPKMFEDREKDKYNWRFPKGESYRDLEKRIIPVAKSIAHKSDKTLVVVGHQSSNRMLIKLLLNLNASRAINLDISSDKIMEILLPKKRLKVIKLN